MAALGDGVHSARCAFGTATSVVHMHEEHAITWQCAITRQWRWYQPYNCFMKSRQGVKPMTKHKPTASIWRRLLVACPSTKVACISWYPSTCSCSIDTVCASCPRAPCMQRVYVHMVLSTQKTGVYVHMVLPTQYTRVYAPLRDQSVQAARPMRTQHHSIKRTAASLATLRQKIQPTACTGPRGCPPTPRQHAAWPPPCVAARAARSRHGPRV